LKDDTSTSIVDPPTNDVAITVVAPNGGESLPEGSSYQIQWTGTGTLLVKIQYSVDNGSSWGLVKDSLKNTGVYDWFPVPNSISNQCRIRVASVDGVSSDASDKNFTIVKNSNESLKINSPDGGESWEAGSAKQIKWYSSGLDSVKIEYTTNNGQRWNLIAVDKKNTGIYYWEPVPNTPSTLAKIRIMDAKDGVPSTESTSTFVIMPEPIIKVLSPNGGEKILAGTSRRIEWLSENIQNVKLAYTTNNGFNWITIVQSTPSTGFYTWNPVPDVPSNLCKIRVYDASDGEPSDVSDSVFTITNQLSKSIKVIYPNGGERWIAGSTQNITWEAEGIQNIKIEYTTNSGVTWDTVAASAPNTKAYAWNSIPSISSDNCKIKVSDPSDPTTFYDESDNFYSMTPTPKVTVTSPNGGEYWQSGSNQEIRWVSENIPNVKIEFTSDGGANWSTIVNSTTTNSGSYPWLNIPNMHSLQCKIKITDVKYGSPTDQSDNNFTISNQVTKLIKVLSPNGGEDWEAGTKQNITWNSSGISKVKIEFSTNKGAAWTVLSDSLVGGAYEWNISETLNSTQCQIRLSDYRDSQVSDISDAIFTISPRKYIFVTQPRGPITYKDSDAIDIVWESSGIKTVGIKFTHTNGVAKYPDIPDFYILVDKVANQGHFTTSFSIPSNQYYVVVYNADEGANKTPSARNIGNFTIVKTDIPSLTLLTPNGGEQWLGNEPNVSSTDYQKYHPYEIRWNGTNLNKVKIEWTTNGGGSWYVVPGADSTANDGSYVWAPGQLDNPVRPDSSDNCKIRVSSVDKNVASINDMTDGFFSIHTSKKIRVVYPNAGQDFYPPDDLTDPKASEKWPMLISWTSYAIQNVNIYYSLDNGVTWNTLATNYQSTGAFSWDFVFGALAEARVSTLGRIKIVDASDNKVWDVNDVPFWLNIKKISGAIIPELKLDQIEKKK
jgi:hypothetical protein